MDADLKQRGLVSIFQVKFADSNSLFPRSRTRQRARTTANPSARQNSKSAGCPAVFLTAVLGCPIFTVSLPLSCKGRMREGADIVELRSEKKEKKNLSDLRIYSLVETLVDQFVNLVASMPVEAQSRSWADTLSHASQKACVWVHGKGHIRVPLNPLF